MGCIYVITNKVNGKQYVGQSIENGGKWRRRQHLGSYNQCPAISGAIKEHGRESFDFSILEDGILPQMLDDYEKSYIKHLGTVSPNGYNLTAGGRVNSALCDESRANWSSSRKGRKHSAETRRKISEGQKGKIVAKSTGEKIAKANMGRKHTMETRRKMRLAHKRRREEAKCAH